MRFKARLLIGIHSVEYCEVNIRFEIRDCNSQNLETGINGQNVLKTTLMLNEINSFHLDKMGTTLFSSQMATGTMSRMSI